MEKIKQQRISMIYDCVPLMKKRKLTHESVTLTEKSVTLLENLPNELFYEIFDYLDVYHIYKAFSFLHTRFQNLLYNSSLPLNINISSMSKSNFQDYHKNIIGPLKHRISSLYVANSFVVNYMFSPVRIASQFTRLDRLVFDNVQLKYLCNILKHLKSLKYLSSLVIIPLNTYQNPNEIYQCIFRLPALKYCKLSLKINEDIFMLPIAKDISSPIEHLVICHNFSLTNLNALLSYVPQLRRLNFHWLDGNAFTRPEPFSCSSLNLTHVSIKKTDISFDSFQSMARYLFNKLNVLHISVYQDREYLDGKRWEKLIQSFIPQLRIFDFQYANYIYDWNDNTQSVYDNLFNQFYSSFWFERNWFFDHQSISKRIDHNVTFYSINPYRRKQYTIHNPMTEYVSLHYQKTNMNSVDHLEIQGERAIVNYVNYFRNATKLTLLENFGKSKLWLYINLKPILNLKQLTTLIIGSNNFRLDQLIELLHLAPNIHTLTLNGYSLTDSNSTSFEHNEHFQLVSKMNRITNITITKTSLSDNCKLYICLFPRMQHFTLDIYLRNNPSIIEFLLIESKTSVQQLCSICIKDVRQSKFNLLKTTIESKKLLDQYSMKMINSDIHIWW